MFERRAPRRRYAGLLAGLVLALAGAWLLAAPQPRAQGAEPLALVLELKGAVGPGTTEYLRQGFETARERSAALVVVTMDTPGGLDSSTRDIIGDILASPVPVAVFVTPAGARAASAGTYILYASHLAAMTPGAHLGAATPVQIGAAPFSPAPQGQDGEEDAKAPARSGADAMTAKITNDAAAYIRSLAGLQGRNAEWAELAVREAATLTAEEAQAQGVVEILARDIPDLLAQADGRMVRLDGQPHRLAVAGARAETIAPDWRARTLAVITNPNVAYILLMIGVYGLLFEFMSPGAVGPGAVGAVSLLVGLFALNMLPVDYAGAALILLGIGLLVAEALAPGIGIFAFAGVAALAIGSVLLVREAPGFRISPYTILAVVGASLAVFLIALRSAVRAARRGVTTGADSLLRAPGVVKSWDGEAGLVHVQGEDWQARAASPLSPGQSVRIAARQGLTLIVEPAADA